MPISAPPPKAKPRRPPTEMRGPFSTVRESRPASAPEMKPPASTPRTSRYSWLAVASAVNVISIGERFIFTNASGRDGHVLDRATGKKKEARADIGIALGSGTDVALETGDIVLVKDDLRDVVEAVKLSRYTIRKIRQNLFWAFIYNTIGIPIAAGILYPIWGIQLNPVIAAAAMGFSSVSVVTNSLMMNRYKMNADNK